MLGHELRALHGLKVFFLVPGPSWAWEADGNYVIGSEALAYRHWIR